VFGSFRGSPIGPEEVRVFNIKQRKAQNDVFKYEKITLFCDKCYSLILKSSGDPSELF